MLYNPYEHLSNYKEKKIKIGLMFKEELMFNNRAQLLNNIDIA
ncbi:hypothetical protein Bsph_2907 [Lysinibacillus sphaericus C3-41]|uniref:Uncharacterized protein n=1 Tax=Lysinibacillus sphaericus (strain C3-41) TaxID=444177 RepID=B1HNC6_LYSSC|nr:hypothetical protein Bsph_2907 [Lysinibacillus sphaericus C3-41]